MSKYKLSGILCLLLVLGVLWSCGGDLSPSTEIPTQPKPSKPVEASPSTPPVSQPAAPVSRVDIVYFHPKIRCGPCISVELRTKEVLNQYFKDAVDSGKLTFQAYELQDTKNASLVKKYGAVGSQLFITTIKNGNENIKHVEEVWMPQILNNQVAFEEFMQKLISQSLKDVS